MVENKDLLELDIALFLLLLTISFNFIGETLSCQTRRFLKNNIYAKHFLVLFLIIFTVKFEKNDITLLHKLVLISIVYILFLLFAKLRLTYSIIVFSLLIIIYTIKYYKKNIKNDKVEDVLSKINNGLFGLITFVICFGSITYYMEKRKEYKKQFSYLKYIFGVVKCKNN